MTAIDSRSLATPPTGVYLDVAAGEAHTCAIDEMNALVCWGSNAKTQTELLDGTNAPLVNSVRANSWNQTISTSLVYRFNWTGPVVAKY